MAGHRHGPGRIPEKPKNFKGTLRKLLRCLGAYRFALALVLFAGIRERLDFEDVPKAFKGIPIALITAGILAMAFMGFSGLV